MAYKDKADAIKYNNRFIKEAYDRINLTVPKGHKEEIAAHAAARGESVNGFIGRAITETMERDNAPESVSNGVVSPPDSVPAPETTPIPGTTETGAESPSVG